MDILYTFASCSGLHLIFGLNALLRTADLQWNSSNAQLLLDYCSSKGYNISWELGNGKYTWVHFINEIPLLHYLLLFMTFFFNILVSTFVHRSAVQLLDGLRQKTPLYILEPIANPSLCCI